MSRGRRERRVERLLSTPPSGQCATRTARRRRTGVRPGEQLRLRLASASLKFLEWIFEEVKEQYKIPGGWIYSQKNTSCQVLSFGKKDTIKIFRGEYGTIEGMHQLEEEESDADILKKYLAIHFPHKISPVIKKFLAQKHIIEILTKVISPNVKCMQSMLFVKGPGNGREAAIRGINDVGIKVITITDTTPIPHNGCRPPKKRRV